MPLLLATEPLYNRLMAGISGRIIFSKRSKNAGYVGKKGAVYILFTIIYRLFSDPLNYVYISV